MNCYSSNRVKVVTIGGGTGSSILLRGLKRYVDRIDITAIVSTFDDGGSSGRLSEEFGAPALGDLRRCIAALLPHHDESATWEEILEHRFTSGGSLNDHSLGNLMLLAAWQTAGGLSRGVEDVCDALGVVGNVIPVSDEPARVCAMLEDQEVIRGETQVGMQNAELFGKSCIYLEPSVTANSAALDALIEAQVIVLGPGDLFTSVIPNLLPVGAVEAFTNSSAQILQVCNTAFKAGETGGYAASDFAIVVNRYLGALQPADQEKRQIDAMIVNAVDNPCQDETDAIASDPRLYQVVDKVLARSVCDATDHRVHDADKLGAVVMEYIDAVISQR